MTFETNKDVLDWYEKQPRTLTNEFINNIAWKDIKNYLLHRHILIKFLGQMDG